MKTEDLFKNAVTEELDYTEPDKSNIIEEPKKNAQESLESEVLFKSGVEDIEVGDNAVIAEESLDFIEPVEPEYVTEEVLFKDEGEELSLFDDTALMEESILSDDITNALQTTAKEETVSTADTLQMNFGDMDDILSDAFSSLDKVKVVKKSFAVKMFETDPIILERYNELKNYIMSFKKIKSRVSNTADTFNIGREQLFKLSTSGKSLKLYLNLDVNKIESRFNIIDQGDVKSYEQVPAFLRIKSNRAMKYAYELIDRVISKCDLAKNPKYVPQDYIAELKQIAENK